MSPFREIIQNRMLWKGNAFDFASKWNTHTYICMKWGNNLLFDIYEPFSNTGVLRSDCVINSMDECFDIFLHSKHTHILTELGCWDLYEWFNTFKVTNSTQRSQKLRSQNQRIFKIIFFFKTLTWQYIKRTYHDYQK